MELHARELCLLHLVLLEKDGLLLFGEKLVEGDEDMLRDVDQQFRLQKPLDVIAAA
eukprot:CAMPEP_0181196518 /NCGR_PEP_ID=MMETSP1096-20121128/15512_1 /TAXON_ID=156174 ORGANISM="Chrysochromulina ericina, Strain CCMP281" /NCGR_SAMPLE_ID=MMETSP1096 /ASSEMBLY_ACC=CAM_ASM_000453 /LENGTH=55 /DNA_ID=CAMNT_0023286291 /DNA_START=338 /DNA_END=505 /DNA_ORIENTATION=+